MSSTSHPAGRSSGKLIESEGVGEAITLGGRVLLLMFFMWFRVLRNLPFLLVQSSPHGGRDSIQTCLAPLGLQPPGSSDVSGGVSRCQWPGLRALPSHCFPGSTQWWTQPQETSTGLVNQAASMLGAHPVCAPFPNTDTPVLRLTLDRALPSIPTLALVTGISYPQALGIGYLVMRQGVGARPCSVSCDASPHPPSR